MTDSISRKQQEDLFTFEESLHEAAVGSLKDIEHVCPECLSVKYRRSLLSKAFLIAHFREDIARRYVRLISQDWDEETEIQTRNTIQKFVDHFELPEV